ncbi:Predicted cobalt transporter CbtA [uncultured Rubrobacteraceae bacterium]|uniref:Predicted cobalt transporter CbtA n=1 Tax=uncultured Rubrobacteraceae bacterium TaxID=349277 RepID=A0A6J4QP16_9ACTN|nr:Predicted cobalt transporter CbtA [uncultured Rubrobacteraceae bacterium]
MIALYLRRGMAAGLLAGLLAGLFAFVVGEPLLDRAMGLEASGHHEENAAGGEEEVFGRTTQKVGLFFATGLSGTFFGGLFGLTFAYFRGRLASKSDWGRSVSLAAAVFAGVALIPFIKYPANPPTVGDPETIGVRTAAYFTMVGLSLLAILAAWYASRLLEERGVSPPVRHVAVGLGLVVVVIGLFVTLPATANPGSFPAGLLWSFRLSSLGTQLVLWAGLGVLFGALCERANRKDSF